MEYGMESRRRWLAAAGMAGALVLGGCASSDRAILGAQHYRCDNGVKAVVRRDGTVTVQAGRGPEMLLRDAGGETPSQAVYSNAQMRLETGLGPDGRGGRIEGLVPNRSARCSS